MKKVLIFYFLGINLLCAQYIEQESIESKTSEYLISKILEHENNDSIKKIYVNAYLNKAKSTNNFTEMIAGYYLLGVNSGFPLIN